MRKKNAGALFMDFEISPDDRIGGASSRSRGRAKPAAKAKARKPAKGQRIEPGKQAVFGRSYAAEPDVLIKELAEDEAIKAADTLLLTVPNQLGVDYNAHVIESVLKHVAPALGWR